MENKKLLLIGGGGHCHSVIDAITSKNEYETIGIVERIGITEGEVMGVPIVGDDNSIPLLFSQGWTDAFITIGSIMNTKARRNAYLMLKNIGFNIPIIADKTSIVSAVAKLDEGTFIGKGAIVNANATIGCCSIINTGSIVEHDCTIGEFVHVSPNCTLCGNVYVGNDSHIGAGSIVKQGVSIGASTLVGSGSNVVNNIDDGVTAFGNPCKVRGEK